MQDRVPLYPGRVTLTPVSGQTNTYDMIRADQPTQEGTPLNKANLFSDATAAKYPAGTETVDDVLGALADFKNGIGNQYLWEKIKSEPGIILGSQQTRSGVNASFNWVYSDNAQIGSDGSVELTAPTNAIQNGSSAASVITGKYTYKGSDTSEIVYILSAAWDAYGMSYTYQAVSVRTTITSYGYVNSDNSSEYPPDVSDGYTYVPLGQLGAKVKIETGSYIGTGVSGSSNPNTLTFAFEPKLVFVQREDYYPGSVFIKGCIVAKPFCTDNNSQDYGQSVSWNAKKISWYCLRSSTTMREYYQGNESGKIYYYIAIG